MKESYTEDLANHGDPESCGRTRKGMSEALTGVCMGRVLSRENTLPSGADAVEDSGRQHGCQRKGELANAPARSETSCTYRNSMGENREIPIPPPATASAGGRVEKAVICRTSTMHGNGKSDRPVVPANQPNKAVQTVAEVGEERGLTKRNTTSKTGPGHSAGLSRPSALDRVRRAAKRDPKAKLTTLYHHLDGYHLHKAYFESKRKASAGVDGVTWQKYGEGLMDNLKDLHSRLHRGAYRAKPSRRTYLPKSDGSMRPLGIASLEDKIVQGATGRLLEAIYENDFLGFSYGFRRGRKQHDALDALTTALKTKKISWVLDADVKGYFGAINHEWLLKFLGHRVGDRRILRLIKKWLNAGVIEDGKWFPTEEGSPQGASISPILANVYLHYALDLWVKQWRKQARGDVVIVRWADDFVVGFQYHWEATRFLAELKQRMAKFSLELHPEKTRLIRFGRFARRDCRVHDGRGKPETFDFLGFTFMCSMTRKGRFQVKRKTIRKRMTAKLHEVKNELRKRMHQGIKKQAEWLRAVVRGHANYYSVPGNYHAVDAFRTQVARMWYKILKRRSHKSKLNWDRMTRIVHRWLPPTKILHQHPEERFFAKTRGRSPVR